jgi:hypothetical protein
MLRPLRFCLTAAVLTLSGCSFIPDGLHSQAIPGSAADKGTAQFLAAFYEQAVSSKIGYIRPAEEGKIWFERGAYFIPRDDQILWSNLGTVRAVAAMLDPTNEARGKQSAVMELPALEIITFPPEKCGAAILLRGHSPIILFLYQDGATGDCSAEIQKLKYYKNYSSAKETPRYFKNRYDPDLPFCDEIPKGQKTYLKKDSGKEALFSPPWRTYKSGYCFSREYEVYTHYWRPGKKSR